MLTLLAESKLLDQKISLDALHLCSNTLALFTEAGDMFLAGLKGNQEELLADMQTASKWKEALY